MTPVSDLTGQGYHGDQRVAGQDPRAKTGMTSMTTSQWGTQVPKQCRSPADLRLTEACVDYTDPPRAHSRDKGAVPT